MKTQIKSMILTAAFLVANSVFAAPPPAGNYDIDTTHSKVGFSIKHLIITNVEGRFNNFDGKIDLKETFNQSSVVANIDVKSINTGNSKRDEHLRTADFFDVSKKGFDKMVFKSTAITGTPESFKMTGDLTLHGVTKPVTFDGKFGGAVMGVQKEQRVGFEATGKINRKDFGLNWSKAVEAGPVVGDEVTITLQIAATKASAPAAAKTEPKKK